MIIILTVERNPYKSVILLGSEGDLLVVSEGCNVKFTLENSGEVKTGTVVKFFGKDEGLKIQIIPSGEEYEEIWSIASIVEGSLKVV